MGSETLVWECAKFNQYLYRNMGCRDVSDVTIKNWKNNEELMDTVCIVGCNDDESHIDRGLKGMWKLVSRGLEMWSVVKTLPFLLCFLFPDISCVCKGKKALCRFEGGSCSRIKSVFLLIKLLKWNSTLSFSLWYKAHKVKPELLCYVPKVRKACSKSCWHS